MLNILQTGDLHLGKVLYEFSLIEDQKHMLNILLEELSTFSYNALIIAGDIYDRSIASPEAVCLFDEFLTNVNSKFPNLSVCIISGNHDSEARLSYAANFLKSKNIYISTKAEECVKPIILQNNEGEKACLYQVPFLQAGSLQSKNGDFLKTQSDLVEEAVSRICRAHENFQKTSSDNISIPSLINCHLFTLKGAACDSERLFLGNAELINPQVLSPFLYASIGHLHKSQKVTKNAYYAGSPLAYSFSEIQTEKSFLRVELDTKANTIINITKIPVIPLRKLVQIEAQYEDFETMSEHKNDFIEFTCTNDTPIENIAALLRKKFPYLLAIKQKAITSLYENTEISMKQKRELFEKKDALPIKTIFTNFLESLGLLSDEESEKTKTEWNRCIPLFEDIAKKVEAQTNETD